jgi:hypothetical protein
LSTAEPAHRPEHGETGVQQAFLKQTSLPEHDVVGQLIVVPQLFVTVTPHAFPQAVVLSGVQHKPSL